MSAIAARIQARRGAFTLDVDLTLPTRGITGLFGPSGSGKSTLLRCLAGLDREVHGMVSVEGDMWMDSGRGVFEPTHRRGAAYVFQEADLFPHLDVAGNLEFAERRRTRSAPPREEVCDWLGIESLLTRRANGLSGGERQRVSLARAILSGPRVLLLDEPLSALDEAARHDILPRLERLPDRLRFPILYVSHALAEVSRLSEQMVWLVGGRVRGVGPTAELLSRLDFAHGQGDRAAVVVDTRVRRHDEAYELTCLGGPWGDVWVRRIERATGDAVRVRIAATDVSIETLREAGSSVLNRFPLTVREIGEGDAGQVLVRLGREDDHGPSLLALITRLSRDRLDLAPGSRVWAGVKGVAVVE